jgi:cellulose synthase operon protein C
MEPEGSGQQGKINTKRSWALLLRCCLRRRRRLLTVLLLVGLLGLGAWLLGPIVVAEYHLRAANTAVERYHNLEAQYHLKLCARRGRTPRALLLAARVARRVGSFDVAEQCLEQYQDQLGSDDDLLLERVLLRAASGEVDEVSAFCRARVEEEHPSASLIREAVSAGLIQVYRLQEAEHVLREWLKLEPDNTQALLLDGTLSELRLNTSAALDRFRRVVELDPEHDEARLRMAAVLVQHNDGAEALPHVRYLSRRMPDDSQVQLFLAQCQGLLGEQDEARETLDALLLRQPNYVPALAERGKLALRSGDSVRAETWLSEAVRRDSSALDARHLLARALRANGKETEAQAQQEALAQLEEDVGRIQKIATEQMQQRPNDPALLHEVGVIALRAGASRVGMRWLYKALRINPKHAPTHQALASWYQRTGNSALAARHRRLAEPATGGAGGGP